MEGQKQRKQQDATRQVCRTPAQQMKTKHSRNKQRPIMAMSARDTQSTHWMLTELSPCLSFASLCRKCSICTPYINSELKKAPCFKYGQRNKHMARKVTTNTNAPKSKKQTRPKAKETLRQMQQQTTETNIMCENYDTHTNSSTIQTTIKNWNLQGKQKTQQLSTQHACDQQRGRWWQNWNSVSHKRLWFSQTKRSHRPTTQTKTKNEDYKSATALGMRPMNDGKHTQEWATRKHQE